jgi:ubiquinone/menaquinone biosynthesis C-methylase UbiE
MGTAAVQGALWGARARDWAEIQEPSWRWVYDTVLSQAGVRRGTSLLDIGCGAGGALVLARAMGAEVTGLDASVNLATIARERLPGARIEVGEMEALPFADESFDIVIGVNSFQFAGDMVRALIEARRVCRTGGAVFALTWGRREDCELMTAVSSVMALLPPPPPGTKSPGPLVDSEMVMESMRKVGLEPSESSDFSAEIRYADLETAVRASMSAGVTVRAAQVAGEEQVSMVVRAAMSPFIRADGAVVLANRFNWTRAMRSLG